MIQITTPATSRQLLTDNQLCAAAGVAAITTRLTDIGLSVSDTIAQMCRVISDTTHVPTLLSETITETLRDVRQDALILSRAPITEVTSVTVDGAVLTTAEYEIEKGLMYRLSDDSRVRWCAKKIVIVYKGGLVTVPSNLVLAASEYVKLLWSREGRDLTKKAEWVDGMGKDEWFENDQSVMDRINDLIAPYVQYGV